MIIEKYFNETRDKYWNFDFKRVKAKEITAEEWDKLGERTRDIIITNEGIKFVEITNN